jgi:hypothetical protein
MSGIFRLLMVQWSCKRKARHRQGTQPPCQKSRHSSFAGFDIVRAAQERAYRMNATITRAMGSIAATANAKILYAASLLMTHLFALQHGGASKH